MLKLEKLEQKKQNETDIWYRKIENIINLLIYPAQLSQINQKLLIKMAFLILLSKEKTEKI